MGLLRRLKQWRYSGPDKFDDAIGARSADRCIDAAEYELKSIMRDVARVRLNEARTTVPDYDNRL